MVGNRRSDRDSSDPKQQRARNEKLDAKEAFGKFVFEAGNSAVRGDESTKKARVVDGFQDPPLSGAC
jgi:hypothetical protein